MSVPILEKIAVNLLAAINEITTDNGWNQTLTAKRPKRINLDDEITEDLTAIIQQENPVKGQETNSTIEWHQPFAIQTIVIDSDAATTPIDTRLNTIRADVEKKVGEDITRGGYARDQRIMDPVIFDGPKFTGIAVNIVVIYRTLYGDPYTQG